MANPFVKNALIYISSFAGHRQVYVFVLAHVLRKLGYNIYIVGNFSGNLKNSFYLDKLTSDENISIIDSFTFDGNGIEISHDDFIDLQRKYNIVLTIFAEADNHIPLFNSQLFSRNKRFIGRTIGIFIRPFYFYHKLTITNKLRYMKRLNLTWRSDVRFFHEVLNPQFKLLDASLHIDDYFVYTHKKTIWLPDVFQQYADNLVVEEYSKQRIWLKSLDDFKRDNKGHFLLLYFGTAQKRRGYDQLLKLAVDYNACFIHCGLRVAENQYDNNVEDLRKILRKSNRLFETNEYITDPTCIEYFFKSVSHLILPYDNFYGSSGVMLQALGYDIPVLVPDIGIMGYRVKKYKLGNTYYEGEFENQFLAFINTPKGIFSSSIESYMKLHSNDKFQDVLINSIKG